MTEDTIKKAQQIDFAEVSREELLHIAGELGISVGDTASEGDIFNAIKTVVDNTPTPTEAERATAEMPTVEAAVDAEQLSPLDPEPMMPFPSPNPTPPIIAETPRDTPLPADAPELDHAIIADNITQTTPVTVDHVADAILQAAMAFPASPAALPDPVAVATAINAQSANGTEVTADVVAAAIAATSPGQPELVVLGESDEDLHRFARAAGERIADAMFAAGLRQVQAEKVQFAIDNAPIQAQADLEAVELATARAVEQSNADFAAASPPVPSDELPPPVIEAAGDITNADGSITHADGSATPAPLPTGSVLNADGSVTHADGSTTAPFPAPSGVFGSNPSFPAASPLAGTTAPPSPDLGVVTNVDPFGNTTHADGSVTDANGTQIKPPGV